MRLDRARCGRTSFTSMGIGSRLVVSATMLVLASTVEVPSATSETVRPMAYLPPVDLIDNNASRGSKAPGFGARSSSRRSGTIAAAGSAARTAATVNPCRRAPLEC